MYLCPHVFNFPPSISIKGSQVDILLGLAPTGNPKYLKDNLPSLQFKKLQANSINSLLTFTPINELLKKLIFNPDAISKPLRSDFIAQRFSTVAFPMQSVSSVYCKWDTTNPFPPNANPSNKFRFTAFFIKPLKPSATNKNKKGARGSPCLSPRWILISSVGLPFTRTDILPPNTHAFIHTTHLSQNPLYPSYIPKNPNPPNHMSFQSQP